MAEIAHVFVIFSNPQHGGKILVPVAVVSKFSVHGKLETALHQVLKVIDGVHALLSVAEQELLTQTK